MLTYTGKYNSANVMIDEIDETTVSQIYAMLNNPAFADSKIVIMPDTHAGAGAVIGFTMTLNNYIVPNVVGVDIGCGIEAVKLIGIKEIDFEKFDKYVRKNIPAGFNKRNDPIARELDAIPKHGVDIEILSEVTNQDSNDVLHALGTLGGGNHFIEIDKSDSGEYWLSIHTGSRNFGLKIAKYHQDVAKDVLAIKHSGTVYKDLEFLEMKNTGKIYLEDMKIAQHYAALNRFYIFKDLLSYFGFTRKISSMTRISSVHNYINEQDIIIRKGAISAYKDEYVIIPLNMRDGIIVGIGKSNANWNYSAPHGAGRIMSRSKAKENIDLGDYTKSMEGIWTSCINNSTIDEAPQAYKNKDLIIDSIKDTVDIKFMLKPVYNFKSEEESNHKKKNKESENTMQQYTNS